MLSSNVGTLTIPVSITVSSVVLSDDFNRTTLGNTWETQGTVGIINNELRLTRTTVDAFAFGANTSGLSNAALDFDYREQPSLGQNNMTYVFLRYQSLLNYCGALIYCGSASMPAQVRLVLVENGQATLLNQQAGSLSTGRYRLSLTQDVLRFCNVSSSASVINLEAGLSSAVLNKGKVGFGINEFTIYLDNVVITNLGSGLAKSLANASTSPALPQGYALSNYPNPFNPQTMISYSLPEAAEVSLEIYNLLGQRVATLVDAKQEAGWHQALWHAGSNPSGVYLYRFVANRFSKTGQLMLVK